MVADKKESEKGGLSVGASTWFLWAQQLAGSNGIAWLRSQVIYVERWDCTMAADVAHSFKDVITSLHMQ